MASLTEILAAGNSAPTQGVDVAGNLQQGMRAGVQLATAKEDVELKKTEVASQKADLTTKQASTVNSLLTNLARANPVVAKKMVKQVREKLLQLGADPEIADYTISDDANRQRQIAINNMVSGKLSSDPEMAGRFFQDSTAVLGWDGAMNVWDNAQKKAQDTRKLDQGDQQLKQQNEQFYANLQNQKDIAGMSTNKLSEKENIELRKEARKETKQLDNDLFAIDATLKDLERIKTSLGKYSNRSVGGTGPVSTLGGLTKYANQDTEELDSAFKKVSLDSMVKMFAGMSKAVDTNAERRAFEATQPSLSLDDKTNMKLVDERIASAKAMKEKYLNAKKGIGYKEGEFETADAPPPADMDIEKKKQAAIAAGYSEAEVNAYVQKLMNASK